MKILIADDDLTTRLMLRGVFKHWGFTVDEASDGHAAWEQLTGVDPAPLAVLDWIMPGLNGPDLCRQLKQRDGTGLPYIILLTAKGERQDIVAGLDAGADDFIVKPYDPQELRARVGVGQRMVNLRSELIALNQDLERRVCERTAQVERLLKYQQELTLRLGHDFKTPLTPMLSLLPLVLRVEQDPVRREMLELALDGARSIHAGITRVLELCRLQLPGQTPNCQPKNLRELVDDTLSLCVSPLGRSGDRTLSNEVPDELVVSVDSAQIQQALGHVLGNALKFTQPDGRITIRGNRQNSSVTVVVTDDGLGLEAQHLERIFEPFYKTDPSRHLHGEPGLGLAIARTIIERHGGRMWAESAGLHQGTTLNFTLPAAGEENETACSPEF
ncbi:MAG TPA: response regulator [Verrucomicrobiae bacterium]